MAPAIDQSAVKLALHGASLPDDLRSLSDKEFASRLDRIEDGDEDEPVQRSRWLILLLALVSIVCLFALHLAIYWPFLAFTHWLHPASPPVAMRQHEWVLAGVDCLFVAVLSAFWSFACLDLGSMRVRRMVIDMLLSDAAEVLPAYITAAFIHSKIVG